MVTHDPSQSKPGGVGSTVLPTDGLTIALEQPITIRSGRNGFFGLTGTELRIATDGSWTSSCFTDDTTYEPDQEGKLSREKLASLLEVLRESHSGYSLESLPATIGTWYTGCSTIYLAVGFREITAHISPDVWQTSEADTARAFLAVVDGIQEVVSA